MTALLDTLDKEERESFVFTKINSIVTRRGKNETMLTSDQRKKTFKYSIRLWHG